MKTYTRQKLTFEQFLEQCPEEGLYELVDREIVPAFLTSLRGYWAEGQRGRGAEGKEQGTLNSPLLPCSPAPLLKRRLIRDVVRNPGVEVRATRNHDDVANFILFGFNDEIRRLNLNYVVNNTAVFKTITANEVEQGRKLDVSVIDKDTWRSNRSAYSALEEPIQLAVEVTSTNWEDDYIDKLDEYQRLGITEYWIVDYLAIGLREYLGNPKVPAVFVFLLDAEGKYQRTLFRGSERIVSRTFPELALTADQILTA